VDQSPPLWRAHWDTLAAPSAAMLPSPPITSLLVATLAVWRLTHLFCSEDGPGDIFVRVRRLAGDGWVGRLLDCFYCLSLWVAAPFGCALGHTWLERSVLWLALSGAAILLERPFMGHPPAPPQATWTHEPRSDDPDQGG
jgi:hypothetical protein